MDSANIISNAPANYDIDPRGIGRIYYDCMIKNLEKVAQICGFTGKQFTFGDILDHSIRIAIHLQNDGVKPGDVIALSIFNNVHCAAIVSAGFFLGAILVGIDEALPLEDMCTLLSQVHPKVIFVVDEVIETLTKSIKKISLITKLVMVDSTNMQHTLLGAYLQCPQNKNQFEPKSVKSLHDTAMIFFTSGTTGLPKGIFRSHLSLLTTHYNVLNCNFCWNVLMETTTPAWTVYFNYLSVSMILGTTRVIYKYFLPEYFWHFTRFKVTFAFLTVFEALTMSKFEKPEGTDLSTLKTVLIGGNILTQTKLEQIQKTFPGVDLYNAYGLTETGTISLFLPRNERDRELREKNQVSIGRGLPGVNFKILSLIDEEPVGPNENGEVRVKVTHCLGDYTNHKLHVLYDDDGWFKTGDLGYYDEDRCILIVDRIKEVFKYQLYRIIPALIEDVIVKHPAVDMAFVAPVPHETDIEIPMGIVTMKPGYENCSGKDIKDYVAARVPDYSQLRGGVKIIKKFPMTHSGKIKRKLVQSWVAEGKI